MILFFIIIQVVCFLISENVAIIHGDQARTGQFPYFAFLEIELQAENKLIGCGATLVSDKWILTAAHCIAKADRLVAKLGTAVLDSFFEAEYMEISIEKENFYVHPGYVQQILWNDIGLIHLPQKIEISEDVRPVQMPNSCDSIENVEVIAMGHGGTESNSTFSPQLNFAVLKTLPMKVCRKALPVILFRKSVICASNDVRKQSIFDGDSGGDSRRDFTTQTRMPSVVLRLNVDCAVSFDTTQSTLSRSTRDGVRVCVMKSLLLSLSGTDIDFIIPFSPIVKSSDGTLIGISSFVQGKKYEDGAPQGFTNTYSYLKWIGEVTGMNLPNC